MTYACTDVYYHSRHTALILFLFIFTYIFTLYQCYLFGQPLTHLRLKKTSFFEIADSEIIHSIFFSAAFTMSITIDYYLIRPSFAVSLMIILYYIYERYSGKFNIFLIIVTDLLVILIIYLIQDSCYVRTLVFLRVFVEVLKLLITIWSNRMLRIHKSGGINLVAGVIMVSWIVFFLLRR